MRTRTVLLAALLVGISSAGTWAAQDKKNPAKPAAGETEKPKKGLFGSLLDDVKSGAKEGVKEGSDGKDIGVTVNGRNASKGGAAANTADAETRGGRPTIQDTELAAFFDKHQKPAAERSTLGWPRVVLTMAQAPSWQFKFAEPEKPLPDGGCWQFTAKIWDSATQSRDVPPFFKCAEDKLHQETGIGDIAFAGWSGLGPQGVALASRESTGLVRTDGPVPPDSPFPAGPAYSRLSSTVTGLQDSIVVYLHTYSGIVLQELVNATHLDYRSRDRRLWINIASAIEPPGATTVYKANVPAGGDAGQASAPTPAVRMIKTAQPCPANAKVMEKMAAQGFKCVDGFISSPAPAR